MDRLQHVAAEIVDGIEFHQHGDTFTLEIGIELGSHDPRHYGVSNFA